MHKITHGEYKRLDRFFRGISPPAQDTLYNTGDHYELYLILCELWFRPPREAIDVYRMAEEVLSSGYE